MKLFIDIMQHNFNINTTEVVALTNKLEKLTRSDMPLAVRGTLNDAAFDMKQIQVEKIFTRNFTIRKKTFIRSHTAVIKCANTFDLKQMKAQTGIIKGKSQAGDQLIYQEFGGTIKNRDYIPTKEARVSKSSKKVVSKKYYLKNIKPKKNKTKYQNQEFIRTVFKLGKGAYIRYNNILFEILTIKKPSRLYLYIKTKAIYWFKKNRSVRIKRRPFMKFAGKMSAKKMPAFFKKQAKRRFEKYLK